VIEDAFREHWARVVAAVVGMVGDLDRAEDAAQDAFAIAAERWPRAGVPEAPLGWLVTTARNRAIDRLRRDRVGAEKVRRLDAPATVPAEEPRTGDDVGDERLELILMCCHPALATEAQVGLTLRALGGLSNEEIARAFLVTPETMKRRLTRARTKIRAARIPFTLPPAQQMPERLGAVLAVVYLIFNEGYSTSAAGADLAEEAIRLARVLGRLMPDEPEVFGLLGLMLCHHSRRAARVDPDTGELVPLAEQDATRWDLTGLAEGRAALDRAIGLQGRGPYVLQAAIASLQAERPVDWPQVAALYCELTASVDSPVVELSRAVAVAEAGDPVGALAAVDALELGDYRYVDSTRAELLRRVGDVDAAAEAYTRAIDRALTEPERRFLVRRRAEL